VTRRLSFIVAAAVAGPVAAHEGHAALPSRGATVDLKTGLIVLSRESREALGVKTAPIETKPLADSSPAYVTLVPPWTKHAFASSRLPGRIAELHAAPGKSVKEGEVLAEVESLELENLHEDLLQARSQLRIAQRLVQTLRESSGGVAGQAVVEAESAVEQHRNAEAVGRLKWKSLGLGESALDDFLEDPERRVKKLSVRAPIGGAVIHADVALGRVVEPGEHLFEIVDPSEVWAKIGVMEGDLDEAKVGRSVELRLGAIPNSPLATRIDAVGPALDGPGRTATAWATVKNPSPTKPIALAGMTGLAKLSRLEVGNAKVVPQSSLIDDGLSQYVLVEEAAAQKQSEYRRRNVTVVRRTASAVQVAADGLFPGDRVVTNGARQLSSFFIPEVLKLAPEASKTIGLELGTVERRSLEKVVEFDGVVELPPESVAAASVRIAGNIRRLHVRPGQSVKRGELLAEVQSLDFQSLQLDLLREDLTHRLAHRRLQALLALGSAAPQRQVLDLEASASSARNRRDTLRRRLEALGTPADSLTALLTKRELVDALPVRAPLDGVVAGFDKALGQIVRSEEPLFAVYGTKRAMVKGFVPERDFGKANVGSAVRLRTASNPKESAQGKVVRSAGVFSAEDQALAVWIEPGAASRQTLRQGQLVRISMATNDDPLPAALVVPLAALVDEGAKAYVFVRKADGEFERRRVTGGVRNDEYVQITEGLSGGESIAVRGASGLRTAHASIR